MGRRGRAREGLLGRLWRNYATVTGTGKKGSNHKEWARWLERHQRGRRPQKKGLRRGTISNEVTNQKQKKELGEQKSEVRRYTTIVVTLQTLRPSVSKNQTGKMRMSKTLEKRKQNGVHAETKKPANLPLIRSDKLKNKKTPITY